jgi:hypothetical protein
LDWELAVLDPGGSSGAAKQESCGWSVMTTASIAQNTENLIKRRMDTSPSRDHLPAFLLPAILSHPRHSRNGKESTEK